MPEPITLATVPRFFSSAEANAANPDPTVGQVRFLTFAGLLQRYEDSNDGPQWVQVPGGVENYGKIRCDAFHDALDGNGGYMKTQCVRVDRHRGDHVFGAEGGDWQFSGHPMDHPDLFEEIDGAWRRRDAPE